MNPYFIALILFIAIVSFKIKSYYYYKFLVFEESQTPDEGFLKYSIAPRYLKYKAMSNSFFPLIYNSAFKENEKTKKIINSFFFVFYVCLLTVLVYVIIVGSKIPKLD